MGRSSLVENLMSNRITWFKVSLLLILALSMVQCSFKKDDEGDSEPQVVIKEQVETGTVKGAEMELKIVPGERVHEYSVQVSWKVPENCLGKVQKRAEKFAVDNMWTLSLLNGAFSDHEVSEGQKYFYSLVCAVNGSERTIKTLSVSIPTDLTLDGDLFLKKIVSEGTYKEIAVENDGYEFLLKAERIHMKKGLRLITDGLNLRLKTKNMLSENGAQIRTFLDSTIVPAGAAGQSGGRISIDGEYGSGSVDIRLFGQDGGRGARGGVRDDREVHPSQYGTAGVDAEYEIRLAEAIGRSENKVCNSIVVPGGGSGGKVCFPPAFVCLKHATSGTNGKIGLKGFSGQNGFNGGSSGQAYVAVKNGNFKAQISKYGGRGGSGGSGGPGTQGGYGGMAGDGSVAWFHQRWKEKRKKAGLPTAELHEFGPNEACRDGKHGDRGPSGPEGDQGGPGLNGVEDKSYIYNPATQKMDEI